MAGPGNYVQVHFSQPSECMHVHSLHVHNQIIMEVECASKYIMYVSWRTILLFIEMVVRKLSASALLLSAHVVHMHGCEKTKCTCCECMYAYALTTCALL